MQQPANIVIGVNAPISWPTLLGMGVQHCFAMSSTLVLAALIANTATGSLDAASNLVQLSMIAAGVGTILQSLNRGGIGSGYLCPNLPGPAFFPASILAAQSGGLPLVFGMTLVSGLFQAAFSRVVHRARALLPPEVTGVIIAMVGLSLVSPGLGNLTGIGHGDMVQEPAEVLVGMVTLAIIFGFTVWGAGPLRLYSVLVGIVAGYALAFTFDVMPQSHIDRFAHVPLFSWPQPVLPWQLDFEWFLLAPFLIAGLASSIKAVGDLSTAQRINDESWVRPGMQSIKRGVLADALAVITAGLVGGMGQSTSSSNVGLSMATGVTSRKVGFSAGGIFLLCAFMPVLAQVFVLMPRPVTGAVLIFSACFMIVVGLQLVMSRLMDARKTFVVGASIIAGLSVDIVPGLYSNLPPALSSLATSSLSLATVVAVLLNVIFRIGISHQAELLLAHDRGLPQRLSRFMTLRGSEWGARRDVVARCINALVEFVESARPEIFADQQVSLQVRFDQFHLDAFIRYPGEPLHIPATRLQAQRRAEPASMQDWRDLSASIIRSLADQVTQTRQAGRNVLHLRFIH